MYVIRLNILCVNVICSKIFFCRDWIKINEISVMFCVYYGIFMKFVSVYLVIKIYKSKLIIWNCI